MELSGQFLSNSNNSTGMEPAKSIKTNGLPETGMLVLTVLTYNTHSQAAAYLLPWCCILAFRHILSSLDHVAHELNIDYQLDSGQICKKENSHFYDTLELF